MVALSNNQAPLPVPLLLNLPHCCTGCYADCGAELPHACVIAPCPVHRRRPRDVARTASLSTCGEIAAQASLITDAAERAIYLLEYGHDLIARLASTNVIAAVYLTDQLLMLARDLGMAMLPEDASDIDVIVERIDEALGNAEASLQEVEA